MTSRNEPRQPIGIDITQFQLSDQTALRLQFDALASLNPLHNIVAAHHSPSRFIPQRHTPLRQRQQSGDLQNVQTVQATLAEKQVCANRFDRILRSHIRVRRRACPQTCEEAAIACSRRRRQSSKTQDQNLVGSQRSSEAVDSQKLQ